MYFLQYLQIRTLKTLRIILVVCLLQSERRNGVNVSSALKCNLNNIVTCYCVNISFSNARWEYAHVE